MVFYLSYFYTFIPLDVDNFRDSFYLFLFVTEKKTQTISSCQEDKNVTQETKQKLINHTHVHMKYNIRHDVYNVSFKDTHTHKIKCKCISFVLCL